MKVGLILSVDTGLMFVSLLSEGTGQPHPAVEGMHVRLQQHWLEGAGFLRHLLEKRF